jgi:hypothetical protein
LVIFGETPEIALLHLDEIVYGCHADVHHFSIVCGLHWRKLGGGGFGCGQSGSDETDGDGGRWFWKLLLVECVCSACGVWAACPVARSVWVNSRCPILYTTAENTSREFTPQFHVEPQERLRVTVWGCWYIGVEYLFLGTHYQLKLFYC